MHLIEEQLKIVDAGDHLHSVRMTPGQLDDVANPPMPTRAEMDGYRTALALMHTLSPESGTSLHRDIRNYITPVRTALSKAVPKLVLQRIAADINPDSVRQLVSIQITLVDKSLEVYPWELIGEPGALCSAAQAVTVWRGLSPPKPPTTKRWQNGMLLTGSTAMVRVAPFVREELQMISSELEKHGTVRFDCCEELTISALNSLLANDHPVVFHFAGHGTSDSFQFQGEPGPTIKEINVLPEIIADELAGSDVSVAVFNCCESAASNADDRPPIYRIAELADTATVGMAATIQPMAAILFGCGFYASLAVGGSIVEAFYQGVSRLRRHDIYSPMWGIPVMYSRTARIIPFPVSPEAQARLAFYQINLQLRVLDEELAALTGMGCRTPAEWAEQTATAEMRIECIESYLPALTDLLFRDRVEGRHGWEVERSRDELASALSSATATLTRLTETARPEGLRGNVQLFQRKHQRILKKLASRFEEAP